MSNAISKAVSPNKVKTLALAVALGSVAACHAAQAAVSSVDNKNANEYSVEVAQSLEAPQVAAPEAAAPAPAAKEAAPQAAEAAPTKEQSSYSPFKRVSTAAEDAAKVDELIKPGMSADEVARLRALQQEIANEKSNVRREALLQVVNHVNVKAVIKPTYPVNADTVMVGKDTTYSVEKGATTTLEYVGARYKLGLSNLIEANPGVDPIVPVEGTNLIVPNQSLLPNAPHNGLIVNSAEMRIYYYHDGLVEVLPIGIGQLGTDTPFNWTTKVERKRANPTWTPTAKMHAEYAANGESLPTVWPAGPDNPMGQYSIYIGKLYAIHGTNADFGIGLRVSHGCVRLRNEDIEHLYNKVPVGTRVQFINQAIKTAEDKDGNLYIEVHQPLSLNQTEFETVDRNVPFRFTEEQLAFFKRPEINQEILRQALQERTGRVVLLNPADF